MNIFAGIVQNNHYETIHAAVSAVVKRAQSRALLEGESWSLVELALDQEDYSWLCGWATQLTPAVAQRCLAQGQWKHFETEIGACSEATGIGIMLLLFFSEVARRHASERVLWSVVSHRYFREETRKVLFAQDHPKRPLKDAIELATRWLKLRHVFGIEGLQSWYEALYLQLGFTYAGFHNRLPEWLVGHYPTFAMQQLLSGTRQSESFRSLWYILREYRRQPITDAHMRGKLQANPWILQEWIPALMEQARARPQLRAANATSEESSAAEIAFEEEFLSMPALSWDTFGAPSFTCRCLPAALFGLTDPSYNILVGGSFRGQLRRSVDGTYQAHPVKITMPLNMPFSVVRIVALDGSSIQSQTLQLWDQQEDISAFSSAGLSFDPWTSVMSTTKRYYLLLPSDLEIQPVPAYLYHINAQMTLYLLEADWPAQTQVLVEGKLLWQPVLSSLSRPSPLLKSEEIRVRLYEPSVSPLVFQQPFRVRIEHPELYELLYIRLASQSLAFEPYSQRQVVTEPVPLQPSMFALKTLACLDLSLGFQHRETQAIERIPYRLELSVTGATVLEPDGWRALERDRPLNLAQIQWKPLRFYLQDITSWSVLEGTTWIDTAWQRPKQLQACVGFGAPLKLQKSIYNSNAVERAQWIADRVINTGCVGKIVITDEEAGAVPSMEIQLLLPIEPDRLHTIVWWDRDGTYSVLQPERYDLGSEKASWFASLSADCTQPLAVGIAYDGEWLGAWFSDSWSDIYKTDVAGIGVRQLAILSRWFHLPLLDKDLFDYGAHFAREHASEVLPIWLNQEMQQVRDAVPELRFTDGDEGWLAVVRSIYFDWQPAAAIDKLIMNISDPDSDDALPDVAQKLVGLLGRVNPILMARVIRDWIEHACLPQWGVQPCIILLKTLYCDLAEVPNARMLVQKKRRLLEELADVMKVDLAFIEKSLLDKGLRFFQGQAMDVITRRNIATAMHVEPFRRLLSVYLLESINEQLERKRSRK